MSDQLSDLVRQMLDGMHTLSKTDTILGEPIQAKNATLIPVHRLRIGFAAGTAKGDANADARRGQSGGRGVAGQRAAQSHRGHRRRGRQGPAHPRGRRRLGDRPRQAGGPAARAARPRRQGAERRVVAPVLAGAADKQLAGGEEGDKRT